MSFLTKTRNWLAKHQVYAWLPVYTALSLMLPAITHYFQHEYYTALFLVIFALLRAGYHIEWVMKSVPTIAYHICYASSNAIVHFNVILTGLTYRRDITTLFMLILAIYQSLIMLWRLPEMFDHDGTFKDSGWNIYISTVLLWNLIMHKATMTETVFIKGLFWGAYLWRFYMTKRLYPFGLLCDKLGQLSEVAAFMQFAPFTHQAQQHPHTEEKEVTLPPDDLD